MIAALAVLGFAAALGWWSAWRWRKRAAELAVMEERARAYARMSSDWYWEQDENLRFTWLSGGIFDKAGIDAQRFYGNTRLEMMAGTASDETIALFAEHGKLLQTRRPFQDFEYPIATDAGEVRYVSVSGEPVLDREGNFRGYRGTGKDITERKRIEAMVRQMAQYDSLTGLPNRALFNDRLGHALELAKRDNTHLAVLYFDLDRFKPVNDQWGHEAGDLLLKAVAARTQEVVRRSDTVARLGGDEFATLLQGIGARVNAEQVAGKIRASLARPFSLDSVPQPISIGASIGIALFPEDAASGDDLLRKADAAMYEGKRSGRQSPPVLRTDKPERRG